MVAPSAATDGRTGPRDSREALDAAGHADVGLMSYAVKYESAFYGGPSATRPTVRPRSATVATTKWTPRNRREALREARIDAEEGADVLMVKPGLPYLDIVGDLRREFDHPIAAYNVSGEYAMLHAAAEKGWLDLEATAHESLLSLKRAGADLIITYFAEDLAERL